MGRRGKKVEKEGRGEGGKKERGRRRRKKGSEGEGEGGREEGKRKNGGRRKRSLFWWA